MSQFSAEEISDFQEAFGLFDRDSDGYITSDEVGVVIRSLGGIVTDAEIKELVKQFEEKNNMIDFGDFLALMATVMVKRESSDELLEAFKVFDRDGNGFISAAELRHVMMNLGEKLSEEDVDEMIREADVAGTGQVDYTEFVKMITS
ncbi:hypothetical protein EGW08_011052 [Elysia chlorotica]|uniref:EF-hand domain-containing protein n=1 Tax=Elysia chlorotica TaxID=188477 RepID=A0A433THU8_ELYCH|nr:hypothetical protein EGW08_011052 [Elysia chlorotica]